MKLRATLWTVQQAVRLNGTLVSLGELSVFGRMNWLLQEAATACKLLSRRAAVVRARSIQFEVRSVSELGTLVSAVVDVYDIFAATGFLTDQEAPHIVDVGANIGQFSSAARFWCPRCRIVGFEPDPATFGRLSRNVRVSGSTSLFEMALGSDTGCKTLYRHPLSIMSSLDPVGDGYSADNTVPVPVGRLDDVLGQDSSPIDLLKIDVEGYEMEVLLGGTATLGRSRYLLVEIGLGRDHLHRNLELLAHIKAVAPRSSIVRFGRPLGGRSPACQDVLISLESG